MTIETAIRACLNLLADVGVGNWNCEVVERFSDSKEMGRCTYCQRTISLSAAHLADDAVALETIRHEVAHVLSRGDRDHGEHFERALELVPLQVTLDRDFRIEQCGPQGERICLTKS